MWTGLFLYYELSLFEKYNLLNFIHLLILPVT